MFERLDGERATSYVILLVAVAVVAGVLLDAGHVGASVAGSLFAAYAVAATIYLLLRDEPQNPG